MTPTTYIRLLDHDGTELARIESFLSLSYSKEKWSIGGAEFKLWFYDPNVALFELDRFIEIWRSDKSKDIDWYIEWEGMYRKPSVSADASGELYFVATCVQLRDLVKRATIDYLSGDTETIKDDPGETAVKEFIAENMTSIAVQPARLSNNVVPGFGVKTDQARGTNWKGQRSKKDLKKVIENICVATGLAYKVFFDSSFSTSSAYGIALEIYENILGKDLTNIGLNSATGKNGSGNAPQIFSLENGNMADANYSEDYINAKSTILVSGQGVGTDRAHLIIEDTVLKGLSPYNRCELQADARNSESADEMTSFGVSKAHDHRLKKSLTFNVIQTESCLYKRDYNFGDAVTAKFAGIISHKEIVSIQITVSSEGEPETIAVGMEDYDAT